MSVCKKISREMVSIDCNEKYPSKLKSHTVRKSDGEILYKEPKSMK